MSSKDTVTRVYIIKDRNGNLVKRKFWGKLGHVRQHISLHRDWYMKCHTDAVVEEHTLQTPDQVIEVKDLI